MKREKFVYREGRRREGEDPVWAEPNWDAPYHARHQLLPPHARCETCLFWFHGLCGLTIDTDSRDVVRAEDRCLSWWIGAPLPVTLEIGA